MAGLLLGKGLVRLVAGYSHCRLPQKALPINRSAGAGSIHHCYHAGAEDGGDAVMGKQQQQLQPVSWAPKALLYCSCCYQRCHILGECVVQPGECAPCTAWLLLSACFWCSHNEDKEEHLFKVIYLALPKELKS